MAKGEVPSHAPLWGRQPQLHSTPSPKSQQRSAGGHQSHGSRVLSARAWRGQCHQCLLAQPRPASCSHLGCAAGDMTLSSRAEVKAHGCFVVSTLRVARGPRPLCLGSSSPRRSQRQQSPEDLPPAYSPAAGGGGTGGTRPHLATPSRGEAGTSAPSPVVGGPDTVRGGEGYWRACTTAVSKAELSLSLMQNGSSDPVLVPSSYSNRTLQTGGRAARKQTWISHGSGGQTVRDRGPAWSRSGGGPLPGC